MKKTILAFLMTAAAFQAAPGSCDYDEWTRQTDVQSYSTKTVRKKVSKAAKALSKQLAKNSKMKGQSIAVSQFLTPDNRATVLGTLLSEALISDIANRTSFVPVERDFIFKLTE